ncbi:MAG TPA: DUF4338 domain-containing protein [Novosphingobium sp.]|nr:DUF4338 domain-containing protein [Novosphingobium sp.]
MEGEWRYRGRTITVGEVGFIRELILAHPHASRYELSRRLCEAWNWKQANGVPRDMVCRGLLLQLDRAGAIELPAVRRRPPNPLVLRCRPEPVVPDNRPVRGPLSEILPLEIEQVRQSEQEPLFNSLVEQYHYLRYQRPVGEHLKYLVRTRGQAIACLAFSSAPRHLASRDRFIGWDAAARRRNLHLIAYNTRFLILPWVQQAPHLASHILGRMARQVSRDWERFYAHPIHLLETFVDPERFAGTCYRAANWMVVGKTTGRGKDSNSDRPNRSLKLVLVLPLDRRFRELLSQ